MDTKQEQIDTIALWDAKSWAPLGASGLNITELHAAAKDNRAGERYKAMVQWLVERRPDLNLSDLGVPAEAPTGIPVLTANPPGIGFVQAVEASSSHQLENEEDWERALRAIIDWGKHQRQDFSKLVFDTRNVVGWGDSCGLSAFLSVVKKILDLNLPDDVACTGQWAIVGGKWQLAPVEASSLADKAKIAAEWGYRKLLVVEGQELPPADQFCGLEVVPAPAQPERALEILDWLGEGRYDEVLSARHKRWLDILADRGEEPPLYELLVFVAHGLTVWATKAFSMPRYILGPQIHRLLEGQDLPDGSPLGAIQRVELSVRQKAPNDIRYYVFVWHLRNEKVFRVTLELPVRPEWIYAPGEIRQEFIDSEGNEVMRLLYPV